MHTKSGLIYHFLQNMDTNQEQVGLIHVTRGHWSTVAIHLSINPFSPRSCIETSVGVDIHQH